MPATRYEEAETRPEAERFAARLRKNPKVDPDSIRIRRCGGLTFDDPDIFEITWRTNP